MHAPPTSESKNSTTSKQASFFGKGNACFFQPKLTINQPGDVYEQEADAVADQVMRMAEGDVPFVQRVPISTVQRKCASCEEEEKEHAQRKESGVSPSNGVPAPPLVHSVLSSNGRPMDADSQHFMESRFGQDFSQVRIHTDGQAAKSAASIQAKAYTSGRNIVFGSGEYQPETDGGKRLLAHELVHVVQQGNGISNAVQRQSTSQATASSEQAPAQTTTSGTATPAEGATPANYTSPQARGTAPRRATLPQSTTSSIDLTRFLCNCRLVSVTEESLSGRMLPHPGFTYQYCRGRLTATVGGELVPQSLTTGTARLGGGINYAPGEGTPGVAADIGLEAGNTGSEPTVGGRSRLSIGDENTSVDITGGVTQELGSGQTRADAGLGLNIGGWRIGIGGFDLLNPTRGFGISFGRAQQGPRRDTCQQCRCPIVYQCVLHEPPRPYQVPVTRTVDVESPLRYYFRVESTQVSPNPALQTQSVQMLDEVKRRVDAGARITGIVGYASPEWRALSTAAGAQANCDLSISRALRVRELLIGRGVAENQLPEQSIVRETGCELFGNRPLPGPDSQLSQAMLLSGFTPETFDLFLFGEDIPDEQLNEQFLGLLERIPEPERRLQLFGLEAGTPAARDLTASLEQFVAARGRTGRPWQNILGYLRFATVTLTETQTRTTNETRYTRDRNRVLSEAQCEPYARAAEQQGLFGPVAPAPASARQCGNEPAGGDDRVASLCDYES